MVVVTIWGRYNGSVVVMMACWGKTGNKRRARGVRLAGVDLQQWIGLLSILNQSKGPIPKVSVIKKGLQVLYRLPLKSDKSPLTARSWLSCRCAIIGISFPPAVDTMGIQADRHWSIVAVVTVPIHSVEGGDAR